jgi:cytochrome oxidase Cu insertion factor (SCO1/SenC/PrrC family)
MNQIASTTTRTRTMVETSVSLHPMIGEPAPTFELTAVDGQPFALSDWKGKYLVVHFGTSW